jgi:hypothetical protein
MYNLNVTAGFEVQFCEKYFLEKDLVPVFVLTYYIQQKENESALFFNLTGKENDHEESEGTHDGSC